MKLLRLDTLSPPGEESAAVVKCVKCHISIGLHAARIGGWCVNADAVRGAFYCGECVDLLTNGAPK
jgi:hypothetical protein